MPFVCPASGHIVEDPDGPFCTRHGTPLMTRCGACGTDWTATRDEHSPFGERGADFCAACGFAAPWLSRRQLIQWLRDRLNAAELDTATRVDLREVLESVASMEPDDSKALAAWKALRERAPGVWELAKPVLSTLIGAGLKKYLGLG
jgi:hypothetical protein